MILLHNIKTKKTLPIQISQQDYNITRKILGDEFCYEFLVDIGIIYRKTLAKGATKMYSMDLKHIAL